MDSELAAMQRLTRRISAWRLTIAFCFISVGAHFGYILFLALNKHFTTDKNGPAANVVTAFCLLMGFIPPLLLFGAAGFRFGRRMVEKRLPIWIQQISALYGADVAALEMAAAPWRHDVRNADHD